MIAAIALASLAGITPALEVTSNIADGHWLQPEEPIELRLSRALVPETERVAVMIGMTDWTALFVPERSILLVCRGRPVPLPHGETPLVVYAVSPANEWHAVGRWTLRVGAPSRFERPALEPKIDINNKGQVAERHRPDSNAPRRETFQDVVVSVGFRSQHLRNGLSVSTHANALGVSNQAEALRFGQQGGEAPKLDLADYRIAIEGARAKVAVGHLSFNSHRHLMTGVASRGLTVSVPFAGTDITAAALSGNNIVGYDNFFGVSTPTNRVGFLVVGAELLKARPGGARVEASFIDGARRPRAGFTQGQVNDAERGRGAGLRFVGSDSPRRLRVDAGFARSRFSNAVDPLLSQGFPLVPARERTNDAAYVDASYDVLKNTCVGTMPISLTGTYRFERVEPLFRTVSAPQAVRSDLFQNAVEIVAGVGSVMARASQTWSHDNLAKLPSILRTDTAQTTASVTVPTGSLRKGRPSDWLPLVTYNLTRSAQQGRGLPANGGFVSPSQVPNQLNTVHWVSSDWTRSRWRLGYSLNHSLQDNRQAGRETSDLASLVQLLRVGVSPAASVDLTSDVAFERASNREFSRISRTRRVGLVGNWRVTSRGTINAIVGRTALRDASTSRSDVTDVNLQYSHAVVLPSRGAFKPQVHLFGRWSYQSADTIELLFDSNRDRRNWALNTGLTVSAF